MLPLMNLHEIPLEEIDFADESFRISEELDSTAVLDSLRAVGQLNPVCVLDGNPQKAIICGFRRLRALRQLGSPRALARVIAGNDSDPTRCFNLALWDNLSHRLLNPFEKARALSKLEGFCGVPREKLLGFYLPLMGLAPGENVLSACIALNDIHPGLRRCLIDGRLTQASLERLAGMPPEEQAGIAALMGKIRLSASLQRKVLGLLEDLAAIAGAPLAEPLKDPDVLEALEDPRLSSFQKGEKVHQALYRVRNPRLSRAAEQFAARKKQLGLPGSIHVTADPFFETPGLRVEFSASDAARFRELAAELQKASRMPALDELFDIR